MSHLLNQIIKDEYKGKVILGDWNGEDLTDIVYILGNANFSDSQIIELGSLQGIGGYAFFSNSEVIDLGNLQSIGGGADFYDSQITDLCNLQSIGGIVYGPHSLVGQAIKRGIIK